MEYEMCVLILSTNIMWNISDSKKNECSEILAYIYIHLHIAYLLFLSDFNEIWIFWHFLNILKYQISCKSKQWELSSCMQMDRWTDRQNKANSCVLQFWKCDLKWMHKGKLCLSVLSLKLHKRFCCFQNLESQASEGH